MMQPAGLPLPSLAIEPVIDRHPITVAPDIPLVDVLALMGRVRSSCLLSDLNSATDGDKITSIANATAGCVLVMEKSQLVGVFTERDIVRLAAAGTSLECVKIGDVVSQQVITLTQSQAQDIFTVLSLFRQHRIRHIPVLNDNSEVVGIITHESIRKALQPVNLLTRLRNLADVMTTQVIYAPLNASVLHLAQLMAQQRVSCVVITEEVTTQNLEQQGKIPSLTNHLPLIPVGIVTERDIVQFQALDLNLSQLQVQKVMSTPLFCLHPTDSLWVAHEEMQRRHLGRMVVTNTQGELVGIVSQTSLLQVLNPADMYGIIEALQQAVDDRTSELKSNNQLLREEVIERKRAEKALLKAHDELKRQVEERTAELFKANLRLEQDILERISAEAALRQSEAQLREQATRLEQALQQLQKTQTQLIQTEKMSSLGQLVAGVAHEINNPINFIHGNLIYASQYIQDMVDLLQLYNKYYPQPVLEIEEAAETIDLEFIKRDLPKLLGSMRLGADRIRDLVLSLRNFSRLDEAEMKYVDIHQGLDSTLLILQNQIKGRPNCPEIQVIKEYGNLPPVECHARQLNQVFINILTNAIYALEQTRGCRKELESSSLPTIRICTEVVGENGVVIRIADNGIGITEEVHQRLFDPFFTTKKVGEGTGLGLSISYQIVTEKHGGQLKCISVSGQGAEFVIEIPRQQQTKSKGVAIASTSSL